MKKTPPIGLIAGNGSFPLEFARNAAGAGRRVIAVGHRGETKAELEDRVSEFEWVKVGQMGRIIRFLKRHEVCEAAFVGGLTRVNLFGGVAPDWQGWRLLWRMKRFSDDAALRAIAGEVEQAGIHVIPSHRFLQESTPPVGLLSSRDLSKEEQRDAAEGQRVIEGIGALDIGQTVIVSEGVVVAVEAVEGTDAALQRAGELVGRGVVVKLPKPNQDLRFDLPAVGPKTIENMARSGLTALVIAGGKTIVLDPGRVVALANKANIALLAIEYPSPSSPAPLA